MDAFMYDLDRVPRPIDRAAPGRAPLRQLKCPVAVHGYALAEEDALLLSLGGVAVACCLHRDLVETLCKSAARGYATVPPDDALTDLTWVNLVE